MYSESEISKKRPVTIVENASYRQNRSNWELLDNETKTIFRKEAIASISTLIDLEPMIEEHNGDILTLKLQSDSKGIVGDVRDILIIREEKQWFIGISVKHNHFAVKHSRLSYKLDFGKVWLDMPCSSAYWSEVTPIFNPLLENKGRIPWREYPDKEGAVYIPLLRAFMKELSRAYDKDASVPSRLVEYLLGRYDFYKLIGVDREQKTQLMAFNLHGTLNQPSKARKPSRMIPVSLLPNRIISLELKPDSANTVELYLDNGWQFSFRIHNASTMVEPSLKFDIQIIGMPTTIITINCPW